MSGLWATVPRMGGIALFFALASLGLPGLGNFVGEFLVLIGTYQASVYFTVPAVLGLVFAAAYSLSMIQRAFFGPNKERWTLPDLSLRETATTGVMIAALIWLGFFPQQVLNTAKPAIATILKIAVAKPIAAETENGRHSTFGQHSAIRHALDLGN
jgi:NADH-quinone oxidoreductase subunit M